MWLFSRKKKYKALEDNAKEPLLFKEATKPNQHKSPQQPESPKEPKKPKGPKTVAVSKGGWTCREYVTDIPRGYLHRRVNHSFTLYKRSL